MLFPEIAIPTGIQEINEGIFDSSSNTMIQILSQWPRILIALGVVFVGWLAMQVIQWIILKISDRILVHKLSEKIGFTNFLKKAQIKSSPSEVIAKFLGGYILTMFFLAATNILNLKPISEFLNTLIYKFIPHLVVALFIVLIGFQIANTVGAIVEGTLRFLKNGAATIIRLVAVNIIMLFTVLAALFQLGIAEDLTKILFTGLVAMIALAGGLAMGLGAKDFVRDILDHIHKQK